MYIEKDNLCTSIKSNFINTWTCNTLLESPCTYFNIFEFLHISQIGISVKNCTIDWCFIRFLIQNFFKLSLKTENFHLMYHYINECLAHAVTIVFIFKCYLLTLIWSDGYKNSTRLWTMNVILWRGQICLRSRDFYTLSNFCFMKKYCEVILKKFSKCQKGHSKLQPRA